ncbi:MAG: hypothetical protein JSW02_09150 [candidate division WOR-3 bacterium]|nr:MAG: hypothetical protein JSW02_09150 [candidate division WOR-3 bacterium]
MILIFFFLAQIEINTRITKEYQNKELTIGDPFEIEVSVTHPQDVKISAPFVDSLDPFMILSQDKTIVQEKGMETNTYRMRMVPFNTGELNIPAFKFVHTHGDTTDTITSNTPPLTITSVLPEDMQDINDIKDAVEYPDYRPWIILGIVIALGAIGFFGYRFIKKFLTRRAEAVPPPPPWIEALVAIENIPVQEWIEKRLIKKYYYTLSEILKWYIERRYAFNAAEQTTTEIVSELKRKKVKLRDAFGTFFHHADLVKYTKFIPEDAQMFQAIETARDLVTKSKPIEVNEEAS